MSVYSNERKFFCINCGNQGIPIMRKSNHYYGKGHLKKLYCLTCKCEVNHLECRNNEEVEEFKINFSEGKFTDLAKESIKVSNGLI